MDLTSGAPFWIVNDGLLASYPPLKQDRRCDLAIIGGGITGALVAHRFVREGIHVVLVEGREIGFGSTGACTALIQYEIDNHLCQLIDQVGEAHAVRSYELCLDAVRGIERLATEGGDRNLRRLGRGALPDLGDRPALFLRSHYGGRPRHHRRGR